MTKLGGPSPYWLVTPPDGSGPGAGIGKREHPWQSVIPTVGVASSDATSEVIIREGGRIVVPKTAIPGVGHLVTFKDTEGDILAVLEADDANPFAGGTARIVAAVNAPQSQLFTASLRTVGVARGKGGKDEGDGSSPDWTAVGA